MLYWWISFFLFFLSLRMIFEENGIWSRLVFQKNKKESREMKEGILTILQLEQKLHVGIFPEESDWLAIKKIIFPWGQFFDFSLMELRRKGASLIPSLQRFHISLKRSCEFLEKSKVGVGQAYAQGVLMFLLIPLMSISLYWILPELKTEKFIWIFASLICLLMSASGVVWILKMAQKAQYGGLRLEHQQWWTASQSTVELFLALVRSGTAIDYAWSQSLQFLAKFEPELSHLWRHTQNGENFKGPELIFISLGKKIQASIHISLIEGTPCLDRIENLFMQTISEFEYTVQNEISLLSTQTLKPLFIFIAPSVLGLIGFGLYLTWKKQALFI